MFVCGVIFTEGPAFALDTFAIKLTITYNRAVLNLNLIQIKDTKSILSSIQKAVDIAQVQEENWATKQSCGGRYKERQRRREKRGPYSESGDRASSVSRQTSDDS